MTILEIALIGLLSSAIFYGVVITIVMFSLARDYGDLVDAVYELSREDPDYA